MTVHGISQVFVPPGAPSGMDSDSLLHQAVLLPFSDTLDLADIAGRGGMKNLPQCKECGKAFRYARNIKRHYQVFHQMTVLPCEHCNETFSRTDKLRAHIRSKHGIGEKLACTICRKCFPFEWHLERHKTECGKSTD